MHYEVRIDEFEGPLDLLLHLIKQSNIDIYDISLSDITDQYLDYIRKMEKQEKALKDISKNIKSVEKAISKEKNLWK